MPKKKYYDDEEREFIEAYERGEFVPMAEPERTKFKKQLESAAKNHLRKNARVNIRISEADLMQLKMRAAEEGMPYQTLIASVLHKYVSGRLGS